MKSRLIFVTICLTVSLLTAPTPCFCDSPVFDPFADYTAQKWTYGHSIYKWNVDLDNDGLLDVLFDIKPDSHEIEMRGGKSYDAPNTRCFVSYINKGGKYVASPYTKPKVGQIGEYVVVKIDECYVGRISELHRYGLVTIEKDMELLPPNRAYIIRARVFAYTVVRGVVKQTLLAQFAEGEDNAVYSKYLTISKRTPLHIEEIAPAKNLGRTR